MIFVTEKEENVYYELIQNNIYNKWTYNGSSFEIDLIYVLDETEYSDIEKLIGQDNKVIYARPVEGQDDFYMIAGDNNILGDSDDVYLMFNNAYNAGDFVFTKYKDEKYYHAASENVYYLLNIDNYSVTYFSAGVDQDPTTTSDNKEVIIGANGRYYVSRNDGTYYAANNGVLTGTNSDLIVAAREAQLIGNSDDYILKLIDGTYYIIYGDNSYESVTFETSGLYHAPVLSGNRIVGSTSGELTAEAIEANILLSVQNGLYYINNNDGTFTLRGEDALFNTSDDTTLLFSYVDGVLTASPVHKVVKKAVEENTYYYESLGHNVYNRWSITLVESIYNYDSTLIAAIDKNNPGSVNDYADVHLYNESKYIRILEDGTYRGYGVDGLLGTNDDSIYIIIDGEEIEVMSVPGFDGMYHDNEDNVYTKYVYDTETDTYAVSYVCLGENQRLDASDKTNVKEVVIDGNVMHFIINNSTSYYAAINKLLGIGEDILCHVGSNGEINYNSTDSDDILNVTTDTIGNYYKIIGQNLYQDITTVGSVVSLSNLRSAGVDEKVGTSDDLEIGKNGVRGFVHLGDDTTTYYIQYNYENYFEAGSDGLLGTADDTMFKIIDDVKVSVNPGADDTYYTVDDYIVNDLGMGVFANIDKLVGGSDDITAYIGTDQMPYTRYEYNDNLYYVYEVTTGTNTALTKSMTSNKLLKVIYSTDLELNVNADTVLHSIAINGKTYYYLDNGNGTYNSFGPGHTVDTRYEYVIFVGSDNIIGTIDDYIMVGDLATFVGADLLFGTADDIKDTILGEDLYPYKKHAVDTNVYYPYDINTGVLKAEMISAGYDTIIGNDDDVKEVFEAENGKLYYLFDAGERSYATSPTNILGNNNVKVYAGADGKIGTTDDYYNLNPYSGREGYKATFVGYDAYVDAADLSATLGEDLKPYLDLGDNTYQKYTLAESGYYIAENEQVISGVLYLDKDGDESFDYYQGYRPGVYESGLLLNAIVTSVKINENYTEHYLLIDEARLDKRYFIKGFKSSPNVADKSAAST